jgi:hypothetical protein
MWRVKKYAILLPTVILVLEWLLEWPEGAHARHVGLLNAVCGHPPVLCLQDISSTVLKSSRNYVILERTPGIT